MIHRPLAAVTGRIPKTFCVDKREGVRDGDGMWEGICGGRNAEHELFLQDGSVASTLAAKLQLWVSIDDAFTTVPTCQVCNKKFGCSMKLQLDQHVASAMHTKNKTLQLVELWLLQTYHDASFRCLNTTRFYESIVATVSGRIHTEKKLSGFVLPRCSVKCVALCRQLPHMDRNITLQILLLVNLTQKNPQPFLICSKMLGRTNHVTVAHFVNDGLKVLWPDGIQEEEVLVLYSDAASYMLKAATALRVFYPNMIHFTCMAHGLQRITEVCSSHPQVNKIVSRKCFCKLRIVCCIIENYCPLNQY
ncbi:hypothetical protein PR048_005508 [Dryococelus australis]|uniref:DUF659 domain-containing protein n=1 Tax=Dryococelus australis TaxID=614101 RepID=A0ABQ9I8Y7_9NEOP|nr:hypothetical protein PR048_005508 [Dryococelus australis]